MAGTVIESNSDVILYKVQTPVKTVVKSSPHWRSEIESVPADLGVVKKADIEAIVESYMKIWTSTLQS